MRSQLIYEGPSVLTGAKIIAVVTHGSSNKKTGPIDQVWILSAEQHPLDAQRLGADDAVCGDCPMRKTAVGKARLCYVSPMALGSIWRGYQTGKLQARRLDSPEGNSYRAQSRKLRLSAYGDPSALPTAILQKLSSFYQETLGYTGQWRHAGLQQLMASVRSPEERQQAKALGYRTFRVRTASEPILPGEIECPTERLDANITCDRCGLCQGSLGKYARAKDITIVFHGSGARSVKQQGTMMDLISISEPRSKRG